MREDLWCLHPGCLQEGKGPSVQLFYSFLHRINLYLHLSFAKLQSPNNYTNTPTAHPLALSYPFYTSDYCSQSPLSLLNIQSLKSHSWNTKTGSQESNTVAALQETHKRVHLANTLQIALFFSTGDKSDLPFCLCSVWLFTEFKSTFLLFVCCLYHLSLFLPCVVLVFPFFWVVNSVEVFIWVSSRQCICQEYNISCIC